LYWGVDFQEPQWLLQAWGTQVCKQKKPWGLLAGTGLPGAMVTAAGMGEPSLWAVGVLGPDFLHGLQGAQFSGAAAGGTEPPCFCLLLPVEQQELWVLLTQGC
jgi:hypothetical protein